MRTVKLAILSIFAMLSLLAATLILLFKPPVRHIINKCATTNENYRTANLPGEMPSGVLQPFIPQYDNLSSVAIRMDTSNLSGTDGEILVEIVSSEGEVLVSASVPLTQVLNDDWTYVSVPLSDICGKQLGVRITRFGGDGEVYAIYRPIVLNRIAENGSLSGDPHPYMELSYDSEIIPGGCLALCYEYEIPAGLWQIVLLYAFCLAAGFILYEIVGACFWCRS